jgi:hypothetical protein
MPGTAAKPAYQNRIREYFAVKAAALMPGKVRAGIY